MKSFSELAQDLKKLPIDELRKDSTGYIEIVLTAGNLKVLYPVLESFFGPPFKPAGINPSKEASRYASHYGGVEKHQTLYYKEQGGVSSCAMLWPWQDKERVTLKVAEGVLPK